MKSESDGDNYSAEEAARRRDEVTRRMIDMPPKPRPTPKAKERPAPKGPGAQGQGAPMNSLAIAIEN
jgi:hypothetical protein